MSALDDDEREVFAPTDDPTDPEEGTGDTGEPDGDDPGDTGVPEEEEVYTVESYLKGKIRGVTVTDDALKAILAENGVASGTAYADLTEKQRDLCLAGLYVWAATTGSTVGSSVRDSDGDWLHSEGGWQTNSVLLSRLLSLANALYAKWGIETVSAGGWGMAGHGFRNVRDYGRNRRRR